MKIFIDIAISTDNAFNAMHALNGVDWLPDIPIAPPIMIWDWKQSQRKLPYFYID